MVLSHTVIMVCKRCGGPITAWNSTGFCQARLCRNARQAAWHAAQVISHPLYSTWNDIKQRTSNPKRDHFKYYGGRGITMFEPWLTSFSAFEAWINKNLGPRPKGQSLDRINNDGNYVPGNLKWSNRSEQQNNKRNVTDLQKEINKLRALLATCCCFPNVGTLF